MIIKNLSFSYQLQEIFKEVSLAFKENDHVGIIGVNGAGKSTFFKLILGELTPDEGKIILKKDTKVGFLPQVIGDTIPNMDVSVFDYLLEGRPIKKLEEELEATYLKISVETDEKKLNPLMKRISWLQERLDYYDVYEASNILFKIIEGMQMDSALLDQPLKYLSGGQKSKVAFARLLYSKSEILLLDEPTNHLDQDSKTFIVQYLKKYHGLVLIISHDIEFLNEVTTSTLYLDKTTHSMELFPGSYEKYLRIRNERQKTEERLLDKQLREEEKLKKIIAKYIGGNEKKARIAKDRQKKLARLESEKVVLEKKKKTAHFKILVKEKSGILPLKCENLTFGYANQPLLFENLTFDLTRGEKFLIVGENGVGKSTLLKLIMNYMAPLAGKIDINFKTSIGYYAQEHELLNKDKTILENLQEFNMSLGQLRSFLGNFLFTGEDVYKKVSVLSPGERSRVALAKLALTGSNLLILY